MTDTPNDRAELIALRARTACEAMGHSWRSVGIATKDACRAIANATLEAEEAAGLAVVPMVSDAAMQDAAESATGTSVPGQAIDAAVRTYPYTKREG